ncbi:hypothetical protein GCM10011316_38950 [Roseibium aquae]|uniref:Uncharacterized protein n=1 Tax=Roseibium aquae TaxID=1323746 RepID=A0A916X405_9HYPH|nr:hypothetical protein [Roseibium aquae]GGB63282.1 hypothetical protein GCM10011316_38950 [Roseibium aquae]
MTGWKTAAVNGGVVVTMVLGEILSRLSSVDWHQVLPEGSAGYMVAALGIANLVLRHVTSGPAGWRKQAWR